MLEKISAKKLLIGGCILLVGALLLLVLYAVHRDDDTVLKVLSESVDLQIEDFHYTEVGDPDLTWEINADTAKYIKKDAVTLFETIKVQLIFSSGEIYTITGKNGSMYTDTNDMDIYGDVVIVSGNGNRMETSRLNYTDADRKIYTKGTVVMTSPGVDVKGMGMNIWLDEGKISLLSNISAVITENGSSSD